MAPAFGTSGLRGLVTDLTPDLVAAHVDAFAAACETGGALYVGRDLRPSSARIAADVMLAAQQAGLRVTDCGTVPTPALALAAITAGAAAIMVTGSHIPADRNGLKFYTPTGEINKADEAAIRAMPTMPKAATLVPVADDPDAGERYVARYVDAFGPEPLRGLHIGAYTHSTVGRDLLIDTLRRMGATVTELGRSDTFIPVDTEAVAPDTRAQIVAWAKGLDAIVSMDGDGDRPLVADAAGNIVPGDILGQITAAALGAQTVVTPISSNTGAEALFPDVIRTRIGSPYVIAGMKDQPAAAGYEANGGFLLGFEAKGISALMTRDALLPILVPLVAARERGLTALVAAQPSRFTAADRLTDVPVQQSQTLVTRLVSDATLRTKLLQELDETEDALDLMDGLRVTTRNGRVLHIRPSGNAPELRVYTEAETRRVADSLLDAALAVVGRWVERIELG